MLFGQLSCRYVLIGLGLVVIVVYLGVLLVDQFYIFVIVEVFFYLLLLDEGCIGFVIDVVCELLIWFEVFFEIVLFFWKWVMEMLQQNDNVLMVLFV